MVASPLPRLVWNASASAPIGLYLVTPGAAPLRGEMALAWAPLRARALAAERHYLPYNVPLVKHVRAVAGDRVCATDRAISVNGKLVSVRRDRDSAGRPLPFWTGCTVLGPRAVLLLGDAAGSFDGRYFGPSAPRDLIGKATPLWAW
jgi:conjugative transfer signal peptidase TraF